MKAATKQSTPQTNSVTQAPMGLTAQDLEALRAPFSKDRLGVKVQSLNKERTRAMLVLYLQHTDVQERLEQVDPNWTCEVMREERDGDMVYVRTRVTIKGVARENVGEGSDPKAAYSDALKRSAMLFGIGRYLYDSPTVWTDYNEQRDKFRSWSVDDFDAALKPHQSKTPRAETAAAPSVAQAPAPAPASPTGLKTTIKPAKKAASASAGIRPREELNRVLMNLYRPFLTHFPQTQFSQLLQERYSVGETRLMTVEQLEDLVQHLEEKLRSVA